MGRSIGGGCVGLLAYFIIATILLFVMAFILKEEGVIDLETRAPTTAFLVVLLLVNGATAYLAGAIARAIGKHPGAVYGVGVILLGYSLFSMFQEPSAAQLEQLEQMEMSWFVAFQHAALNAPSWTGYASIALIIVGLAVGGLNSSDFKKEEEPQSEEDASSES